MNTRIFYIFHGRYPSEKAAALFAAKSCEALAGQGVTITLLTPRRFGSTSRDPFAYFKVKKNHRVIFLPTIDLFSIPIIRSVAFYISYVSFSLTCLAYFLWHVRRGDWIYSNESLPLLFASLFYTLTLYEVHDYPEKKKFYYQTLFRRIKLVLATNQWKKEQLQKDFTLDEAKIFCERNAVDIDEFTIDVSKEEARKKLGLHPTISIILYTGHLYSWKGVQVLAEAARDLKDVLVCFVGGTEKDVTAFRDRYGKNSMVQFFGHRPHDEIPVWQKAADVLVLPNTAKEEISRLYTSPMKLFEYMASGRPIVASDIPSVRDIVSDREVFFVEPDNAEALAKKIKMVLSEFQEANEMSKRAREKVSEYTWSARAHRILTYMKLTSI